MGITDSESDETTVLGRASALFDQYWQFVAVGTFVALFLLILLTGNGLTSAVIGAFVGTAFVGALIDRQVQGRQSSE